GAISRATDSHIVLREHQQEGVLVLNAVARSSPPIHPSCWTWEWPLLKQVDGFDPTELKSDRKPRTNSAASAGPIQQSQPWDSVDAFVKKYVSPEPQSRDLIIAIATKAGAKHHRATTLLKDADSLR